MGAVGVYGDVLKERLRQDEKFGPDQNHDPMVWLAILGEEYGEAARAALHAAFAIQSSPTGPSYGRHLAELREELIQVAAVAVAAVETLDRNTFEWGKPTLGAQ